MRQANDSRLGAREQFNSGDVADDLERSPAIGDLLTSIGTIGVDIVACRLDGDGFAGHCSAGDRGAAGAGR